MVTPFSPKQLDFIINSGKAKWNLAHGAVRAGKTVATTFSFLQRATDCPDNKIYIVGHTFDTAYRNVVRLILESEELSIFRPFCSWSGKKLYFRDKAITVLGAKDEGAIGNFQGDTYGLILCDEMTLYPPSIIEMIHSRLSKPYSRGYAAMNPKHPTHILKSWIDKAEAGDPNYYASHFSIQDNIYLTEEYKNDLKNMSSGLFYKRNYLGLWCLAEGAVFDFFERKLYVVKKPPRAAEYWIAAVDYGTNNNFACLLIGINTGKSLQEGYSRWVEKEYVWDSKKTYKQKTCSEYADDLEIFLEPYAVKQIYLDPSAAPFRAELRKRKMPVCDAVNDVEEGIAYMTSEMKRGAVVICDECPNLIREIESYVWDSKAAEKGEDRPMKKDDHCFAAGTLISSENGLTSIENIKIGDKVFTRKGLRKVINKFERDKESFVFNIFNNEFKCTEDHKFFTLNRGWVEVAKLIQSDILITDRCIWESMEKLKQLYGTEKDIDAILILQNQMTECISAEMEELCTKINGYSIAETFPKDIISITKTGIPLTMIYPISNVSSEGLISTYIRKMFTQIILQCMQETQLSNGINLFRGESGIESKQSEPILESLNLGNINAKSAQKIINHLNAQLPDSVQITASLAGEENLELMMLKETALGVIKYLLQINILKPSTAVVLAEKKPIGMKKVYDLTVEEVHEYFANGILVSNCVDALRYGIYSHKIPKYQPYKSDPNDYLQGRFTRPPGGFR